MPDSPRRPSRFIIPFSIVLILFAVLFLAQIRCFHARAIAPSVPKVPTLMTVTPGPDRNGFWTLSGEKPLLGSYTPEGVVLPSSVPTSPGKTPKDDVRAERCGRSVTIEGEEREYVDIDCVMKILAHVAKDHPDMTLEELRGWGIFEAFEEANTENGRYLTMGDRPLYIFSGSTPGRSIIPEDPEFILLAEIGGRIRFGRFSGTSYLVGMLPCVKKDEYLILYASWYGSGAGNGSSSLEGIEVRSDGFHEGKVPGCSTEGSAMELKDLDQDGTQELLCFEDYLYHCNYIPTIFKWDGKDLIERSWSFPEELRKAYMQISERGATPEFMEECWTKAEEQLRGFAGFNEDLWKRYIQPIKDRRGKS